MPNYGVDPRPCPDCGHLVYRALVAPVRRPQKSCRVVVSQTYGDTVRCGCTNAAHRTPSMRPRHRLEPDPAEGDGPALVRTIPARSGGRLVPSC